MKITETRKQTWKHILFIYKREMEVETQASESIDGKEREQANLKSPEPLQVTMRAICAHAAGSATKLLCISKKRFGLWIANLSFHTHGHI